MHKKHDPKLAHLFRDTFRETSAFLKIKLQSEKQANQYHLESGIPVEDYFRQEFGRFIPEAFTVGVGKVIDRECYTCGDCDFVIYDSRYAPFVKFPSTQYSRRKFIAFETTYGIIEVKQTLTLGAITKKKGVLKKKTKGSLYDACTKIFAYKELNREPVDATRLIPGIIISSWGGLRAEYNRPFAFAFFYDTNIDIDNPEELENLAKEFLIINETVPVPIRVNGIFVLDKFSLIWSQEYPEIDIPEPYPPALHPEDAKKPVIAIVKSREETLYYMYTLLWYILMETKLTYPNINNDYGGRQFLNFESYVKRLEDLDK